MILKVLIVEDEEIIRQGLVHTIDWHQMNCVIVGSENNGRSGLEAILDKRPDVVMTDIRMPEMNGMDMLDEALKTYSFKIILLTSYAEFDYARRAVAMRAYDYLLKPLDEEKLCEIIGRIHEEMQEQQRLNRLTPLLESKTRTARLTLDSVENTDAYVDVALRRIIESSDQKLCIEGVAEELQVSASYLSRRFKAVTGQTFLDTLNMQRIWQATLLLKEGARTAEVAEKTGFGDYKHFCSVFKRYTGMTPREYLRANQQHGKDG